MEVKIRVFVDSNIIISSVLQPESTPFLACDKATKSPYSIYISDYCIDELYRVFHSKLPSKAFALDTFLFALIPYIEVVTVSDNELSEEKNIRDPKDRKVYRGAVEAGADILLTGDKDLLDAPIKNITIVSPREFLEKY